MSRSTANGVLIALAAVALVARTLPGQEVVRISSTPACPTCRIELKHVVTLGGSPGDSVDVGWPVRRNSRGEYVTTSRWTPWQVAVFSASGKLSALRGRRGDGPGDYRGIDCLEIGPGDTVHVVDIFLRRRTLLAPGTLQMARMAPLPILPQVGAVALVSNSHLFFADGRYVVNGQRGDSALHLVSAEGELMRSFGTGYGEEDQPPPPSRRDLSVLQPHSIEADRRLDVIKRLLGDGGEGRVWAAYGNRYEVELWDTAGRRLRRLARDAEWFRPWRSDEIQARDMRHLLLERERGNLRAPGLPLPPNVFALQGDGQGRLWTLVSVPPEEPGGDRITIIEVLDPVAGRLVASLRVTMSGVTFVAPGLVRVREKRASDDVEVVKIFSVELVEGGRARGGEPSLGTPAQGRPGGPAPSRGALSRDPATLSAGWVVEGGVASLDAGACGPPHRGSWERAPRLGASAPTVSSSCPEYWEGCLGVPRRSSAARLCDEVRAASHPGGAELPANQGGETMAPPCWIAMNAEVCQWASKMAHLVLGSGEGA